MIRTVLRIACHTAIVIAQATLDALDEHPLVDEPLAFYGTCDGSTDFHPVDTFHGYRFDAEDAETRNSGGSDRNAMPTTTP